MSQDKGHNQTDPADQRSLPPLVELEAAESWKSRALSMSLMHELAEGFRRVSLN